MTIRVGQYGNVHYEDSTVTEILSVQSSVIACNSPNDEMDIKKKVYREQSL